MQVWFTVLGVILLLVAAAFSFNTVFWNIGGQTTVSTQVSAGAVCGFAVAGGLCFVAAALAHRSGRHGD